MSPRSKVLVLNPNSSESVTRTIDQAVGAHANSGRCGFRTMTIAEGPPGVVSQEDFEQASALVARYVGRFAEWADAFVIACFSDPGVADARAASRGKPVIGIGEAGLRAALDRGDRVGVIAVADAAIPRHLRYWKSLGAESKVVSERALNLPVAQCGDRQLAFGVLSETARLLRDNDEANVLLLGCAGMSGLRDALQEALGIAVVDPCAAAAAAAASALGYRADS